jgi:hypothetical protein
MEPRCAVRGTQGYDISGPSLGSPHVTKSIVAVASPTARGNLLRLTLIKCDENFFNSVHFCSCWFASAALSLRHSTTGTIRCRQATTSNTAWWYWLWSPERRSAWPTRLPMRRSPYHQRLILCLRLWLSFLAHQLHPRAAVIPRHNLSESDRSHPTQDWHV